MCHCLGLLLWRFPLAATLFARSGASRGAADDAMVPRSKHVSHAIGGTF